jgi:hypothetical protein
MAPLLPVMWELGSKAWSDRLSAFGDTESDDGFSISKCIITASLSYHVRIH